MSSVFDNNNINKNHLINEENISLNSFEHHLVNCNTVCGTIRDLPWRNIWLADNPVEVLNEHPSPLVGRYVPTKFINVRKKDKAGGNRGASVSACADLTNQLLSCWVDPRLAWIKTQTQQL